MGCSGFRVADKELELNSYNEETQLFTIYPCYDNLIQVPQQQPSKIVGAWMSRFQV